MQKQITFLTMMVLAPSLLCAQQAAVQTKQQANASAQEALLKRLDGLRAASEFKNIAAAFALKTFMRLYEEDHGVLKDESYDAVFNEAAAFARKVIAYHVQPCKTLLTLSPALLILVKEYRIAVKPQIGEAALGGENGWYLKFIENMHDEKFLTTIIMHARQILAGIADTFAESAMPQAIDAIDEFVETMETEDLDDVAEDVHHGGDENEQKEQSSSEKNVV